MENILPTIWDTIKNKRILDYLDRDRLGTIIIDGDRYWYEMHSYDYSLPNYVHDYFKSLLAKKDIKYLYE